MDMLEFKQMIREAASAAADKELRPELERLYGIEERAKLWLKALEGTHTQYAYNVVRAILDIEKS
jgi:hypothetical protein